VIIANWRSVLKSVVSGDVFGDVFGEAESVKFEA